MRFCKVGSGFCPILSQRERRDGARRAPPFGETGYQRSGSRNVTAQKYTAGLTAQMESADKLAMERLRQYRDELKKTAGNDEELRARAEALQKQLGGTP